MSRSEKGNVILLSRLKVRIGRLYKLTVNPGKDVVAQREALRH